MNTESLCDAVLIAHNANSLLDFIDIDYGWGILIFDQNNMSEHCRRRSNSTINPQGYTANNNTEYDSITTKV